MPRLLRDLAAKHGPGAAADVLDRLTPHDVLALYARSPGSNRPDAQGELRAHNLWRAARGLKPVVPSWLWPGVPRVRK